MENYMEITDQELRDEIIGKISRHLDILEYWDLHILPGGEFMDKYGYWGVGHQNFLEVRFYPETNGLLQVKKLLSNDDEYFILPVDQHRKLFKGKVDLIDELFADHRSAHLIISETKFNWVVIKDEFNRLIWIGNYIRKKMGKKIHMAFDDERIMISSSDIREEEE